MRGEKPCSKCGKVKPLGGFSCDRSSRDGRDTWCRDCRHEQRTARYWADPDKSRQRQRERNRQYWGEQGRKARRDRHRRTRAAVFDHCGWACTCCGSADRLQIDHMNGGGTQHRIELFGSRNPGTYRFYRWLLDNGFPDGFQTLCGPCNQSKRDGERCRLGHKEAAS